jgi:hypothetical protein
LHAFGTGNEMNGLLIIVPAVSRNPPHVDLYIIIIPNVMQVTGVKTRKS